MKIQKIEVTNFKAISDQEMNFSGCSAIVTAGNNKGKTSALRGLVDRFQGVKPSIPVKEGEEKGTQVMELTDGSIIEWKFTEKSESFSFTTKEGIKMTTGVLSGIGEKYFGKKFDIDKFLSATPKAQIKALQELVGLDFTDIDERYKTAYSDRTDANKELSRIRGLGVQKPEKVEKPDVSGVKEALRLAREQNEERRKVQRGVEELNQVLDQTRVLVVGTVLLPCFDVAKAEKIISNIHIPDFINVEKLESEVDSANDQLRKFDSYERDLTQYDAWIKQGKEAKAKAEKLDDKVKGIEAEKKKMISDADMPSDFDITDDGIIYKGFPLTDSQISSSGKYIAALKLGKMVLGEIKSMHFDASFLDNISLKEIQVWANKNDLQLLIERPDLQGGEIKYEIIEQ